LILLCAFVLTEVALRKTQISGHCDGQRVPQGHLHAEEQRQRRAKQNQAGSGEIWKENNFTN